MDIKIDRSLPVTIVAQLQGQIEYGVAFGSIPSGSRLPAIRELAQKLEISPVTVAQVYKALQHKGIIESRAGAGTFISSALQHADGAAKQLRAIHELLDHLIRVSDSCGLSRSELQRLIDFRLRDSSGYPVRLNLIFVGNFLGATHTYITELHKFLDPNDRITATTLDGLHMDRAMQKLINQADLIITLAHRVNEVRTFLKQDVPIVLLNFIPAELTRTALAELKPNTRLGLISTYPEFLNSLKDMVLSFAPHVNVTHTAVQGSPQVNNVLHFCEVVIYTTGSESVLKTMPGRIRAIEFRYVPDPRSIEADLLPTLETLRHIRGKIARDSTPLASVTRSDFVSNK